VLGAVHYLQSAAQTWFIARKNAAMQQQIKNLLKNTIKKNSAGRIKTENVLRVLQIYPDIIHQKYVMDVRPKR